MIVFNYLAAGFVIAGMAIGYGIQSLTGQVGNTNVLAASIAFFVMVLIDGTYRLSQLKNDPEGNMSCLLLPSQGGHFMFLPVWLAASIMFVQGLVEHQAAP